MDVNRVKIKGGLNVTKGDKVRGLESDFLIGGQNRNYGKVRGIKVHLSQEIKHALEKFGVRRETSPLKLLVFAFHLNHLVLNGT